MGQLHDLALKLQTLLKYQIGGTVPVWFPTVAVLIYIVNKAVDKAGWTTAKDGLQVGARFLLKLPIAGTAIAMLPFIGAVLHLVADDEQNVPPTMKMRFRRYVAKKVVAEAIAAEAAAPAVAAPADAAAEEKK